MFMFDRLFLLQCKETVSLLSLKIFLGSFQLKKGVKYVMVFLKVKALDMTLIIRGLFLVLD